VQRAGWRSIRRPAKVAIVDVTEWLLDSDPAIRWQVMRDLLDAPAEKVFAERDRVAAEGWGARLLALQDEHGQWGGGTYLPKWTSTTYTLLLLRHLGLDPASDAAHSALDRVRQGAVWPFHGGGPFFGGEMDETCINGMVLAIAAYFGETGAGIDRILERLFGAQLEDGGWNCQAPKRSRRSSFHTTISVLEGLLEYERSVSPDPAIAAARARGEEYLLERRLFRSLSTGAVINADWTLFSFPPRWHYDVLRGLDYFREAAGPPDHRCAEAIELVHQRRRDDGRWPLQHTYRAQTHFAMEAGDGKPSRWNTLRARRVLRWYEGPEHLTPRPPNTTA
jgi:hypothetical protein